MAARQDRTTAWSRAPLSVMPLLVASLLGVIATAYIALYTSWGQRYDERAGQSLHGSAAGLNHHLATVLREVTLGTGVVALLVMLAVAAVRRRFRVGLAALILVVGSDLTTQMLKRYLLNRVDFGHGISNSLPSGHTTVVFSLVLAAVLVAPRGLRWLVALLGAAVATLTGLSTVITGWHRPGDVVAALLVCLFWAALASSVAGRPRDGRLGRGGGMIPAVVGAALAAFGLIIYGFGWTAHGNGSGVIPFTSAVIAAVAAFGAGAYARLVSRTSN